MDPPGHKRAKGQKCKKGKSAKRTKGQKSKRAKGQKGKRAERAKGQKGHKHKLIFSHDLTRLKTWSSVNFWFWKK